MKKFMMFTLIAVFSVALMCAGSVKKAEALSISIDDVNDGFAATVVDVGMGVGLASFNGSVGSWIANITTGLSYPLIGASNNPAIDLNSVNVSSSGAGHMRLIVEDTYASLASILSSGITGFAVAIGGTSQGTIDAIFDINGTTHSLSWASFAHLGNAFAGSDTFAGLGLNDPLTLKITVDIYHTGAGVTSFNAEIAPVPEPGTIALLGIGLAGLVGVGVRRRAKKNAA